MRHTIFIGSSSEELTVAKALRDNFVKLGHSVKLWDQGVFTIGKIAFEALLAQLDRVDAAVFVFAPNDLLTLRGSEFDAVRDNVVFELGLFTGRLGRDRTFWVVPKGLAKLRITSDLLGVLPGEYEEPRDDDWASALAPVCDQIHAALVDSARARALSSPFLTTSTMQECIAHVNCVMHRIASTVVSGVTVAADDCVEALPDEGGFTVRCGLKSELTVKFGRIQDCDCTGPGSVVALPGNEFFDDECVTDSGSALGSFVLHHFGAQVADFKRLIARERARRSSTIVERRADRYQESYGVGTSLWFDAPLGSNVRLIISAVTRMRAPEGLKAEPAYIFAAVRSITRIMNDNRLTELQLPLFGAGHGDMDDAVALFCLALALACTPDIRKATIVVLPPSPQRKIGLSPDTARRILASVVAESR